MTGRTSDQQSSKDLVARWSRYPGAQPPERARSVDAYGVRIAVFEWGNEQDPVLMLAHGGADFARTMDAFAPLLAAGGYRVVAWDHRSHGDSEPAALHSWESDCRDAVAVLDSCMKNRPTKEKAYAVGHSKGGGLMTHLCVAMPDRFHCLVNIDGVPARGGRWGKTKALLEDRVEKRDRWLSSYLEHRRKSHSLRRRPGTLEELVERRARLNPRLSKEWLRYLATVGARQAEDGWRWKLDPLVRMGNPGPWRPEWSAIGISAVQLPMLAILGRHPEMMGWGAPPEKAAKTLPSHAELAIFDDSGHFVHIEHPNRTAETVLEFLNRSAEADGSPETDTSVRRAKVTENVPDGPVLDAGVGKSVDAGQIRPSEALRTVALQHGRLKLALHQLSAAVKPSVPPLLCIHELGAHGRQFTEGPATDWQGEVWALDLAGHGESEAARGGGYTPEWQLADVDAALNFLSEQQPHVVLFGQGFGAYLALLAIGSRPQLIEAALLTEGEGLVGGGSEPGPPSSIVLAEATSTDVQRPDPLAIAELQADVRPPGYAAIFCRQVAHLHPRSTATEPNQSHPLPVWISVESPHQPPWLSGIAAQCRSVASGQLGLSEIAAFCDTGAAI